MVQARHTNHQVCKLATKYLLYILLMATQLGLNSPILMCCLIELGLKRKRSGSSTDMTVSVRARGGRAH